MRVSIYRVNRKELSLNFGIVEIKVHQPRFIYNYSLNKLLKKSIQKYYCIKIEHGHTVITFEDADYVIVLRKIGSLFSLPDEISESVDKFIEVIKELNRSMALALRFGSIETESEKYISEQIKDTEIFIMK